MMCSAACSGCYHDEVLCCIPNSCPSGSCVLLHCKLLPRRRRCCVQCPSWSHEDVPCGRPSCSQDVFSCIPRLPLWMVCPVACPGCFQDDVFCCIHRLLLWVMCFVACQAAHKMVCSVAFQAGLRTTCCSAFKAAASHADVFCCVPFLPSCWTKPVLRMCSVAAKPLP